ncbi:MAG: DNA recombination protein RmuC [Phycisphaeraceae bacterium]|nr:DNA recombination protein RmuC [Phycisphaeraceae bacterium]
MSITTLLLVLLGSACVGLGLWAWRERGRASDLNRQLHEAEQAVQTRDAEIVGLRVQVSAAKDKQDYLERHFQQTQQQLRETFSTLAGDALKASNEQFLQLAQEKFKGVLGEANKDLDARKTAVETLVKPLTEKLQSFDQNVKELEQHRTEAYAGLKQQLGAMTEDQRRLKQETANLVQALRRPDVRGRWGEMQLKRVAELAGMVPYCDFQEQFTTTDGADNALRPDMIVRLPADRTIVVDAKTPLDAYLSALECTDPTEQEQHLKRHVQQIEAKVSQLASKPYAQQFERSIDFVVLFIPGESFLHAAVSARPDLLEKAMEKNVVIATPSTLVALLRAVAAGWREEKIAQEAQRIGELGKELHERLVVAMTRMQKLGGELGSAVTAYNDYVGSINSRVLVSARKLEDLAAKSAKSLPEELPTIDQTVREVVPRE